MQRTLIGVGLALMAVGGVIYAYPYIRPGPDYADSATVPPARDHELAFQLEKGHRVEWRWTAGSDLRFDVHSHPVPGNPQVTEHLVVESDADSGSFEAPSTQAYSLTWRNLGTDDVELRLTVEADGWQLPVPSPSETSDADGPRPPAGRR